MKRRPWDASGSTALIRGQRAAAPPMARMSAPKDGSGAQTCSCSAPPTIVEPVARRGTWHAVISRAGSNPKTALTNSFKYFDRDRNGRIDYDEIALSIENAGIKFESSLVLV